ncbi:hypothetical protein [Burkholderia sp. 3C]
MNNFIFLRNRSFEVATANLHYCGGIWSLEIEAKPQEFDGELWTPRLYHQGFNMHAHTAEELQGMSTSWEHKTDASYPHPELGLLYVFGHHDVYDTTLSFGRLHERLLEVSWSGLCDVFWDGDYMTRVPFRSECRACCSAF